MSDLSQLKKSPFHTYESVEFIHKLEVLNAQNNALKNALEISTEINSLNQDDNKCNEPTISCQKPYLENELEEWQQQVDLFDWIIKSNGFFVVSIDEKVSMEHEDNTKQREHKETEARILKCRKCSRKFQTQKEHDVHYKKHGLDDGTIKCVERSCIYKTNSFEKFKTHINLIHRNKNKTISYKCKKCQESFDNPIQLRSHEKKHLIKIHAKEKPSEFANRKKESKKNETVKNHKCDTEGCKAAFVLEKSLINHIEKKHTLKPISFTSSDIENATLNNFGLNNFNLEMLYSLNRENVPDDLPIESLTLQNCHQNF